MFVEIVTYAIIAASLVAGAAIIRDALRKRRKNS